MSVGVVPPGPWWFRSSIKSCYFHFSLFSSSIPHTQRAVWWRSSDGRGGRGWCRAAQVSIREEAFVARSVSHDEAGAHSDGDERLLSSGGGSAAPVRSGEVPRRAASYPFTMQQAAEGEIGEGAAGALVGQFWNYFSVGMDAAAAQGTAPRRKSPSQRHQARAARPGRAGGDVRGSGSQRRNHTRGSRTIVRL